MQAGSGNFEREGEISTQYVPTQQTITGLIPQQVIVGQQPQMVIGPHGQQV